MTDERISSSRTQPLRHLKILPTKARTENPWLVAWGYSIRNMKRSGREVITFRPEAFLSEHRTRGEAERMLRTLAAPCR